MLGNDTQQNIYMNDLIAFLMQLFYLENLMYYLILYLTKFTFKT